MSDLTAGQITVLLAIVVGFLAVLVLAVAVVAALLLDLVRGVGRAGLPSPRTPRVSRPIGRSPRAVPGARGASFVWSTSGVSEVTPPAVLPHDEAAVDPAAYSFSVVESDIPPLVHLDDWRRRRPTAS